LKSSAGTGSLLFANAERRRSQDAGSIKAKLASQ
jgi:hypothetical protein